MYRLPLSCALSHHARAVRAHAHFTLNLLTAVWHTATALPEAHTMSDKAMLMDPDAAFPLHGVVKRTQLLRMIKFRMGIYHLDPNADVPASNASIPPTQVGAAFCSAVVHFQFQSLEELCLPRTMTSVLLEDDDLRAVLK